MQLVSNRVLFRTLRKIQNEVNDKICNLNNGGCGVFAYLVGEELKNLGVEVEVITPVGKRHGQDKFPAEQVRHFVRNKNDTNDWDTNGLSRKHLAVRFKTNKGKVYTYDSDAFRRGASKFGIWGDQSDMTFGTGLTVEECRLMSESPDGWNPTFNRRQIPKLRRIVFHHFSKLSKELAQKQ